MTEGPFLINLKAAGDNGPLNGQLETLAVEAMDTPLLSVMDKEKVPPSGDKHDWMNLADYSWPNPDTPDGLPYINRDGEANPEAILYDRRRFNRFIIATLRLGTAWQSTGKEPYAVKATELIQHWFIDPGTAMNPNLRFAHHVPGDRPGRMDGLIVFCSALPSIMDIWVTLQRAGFVDEPAHQSFSAWARAFLDWLLTDSMSLEHAAAANNHGTYHEFLVAYLMLFLNRKDDAAEVIQASLQQRLVEQVKPDGEQPMETQRTLSAQYSLYNLKALMSLARLGESVDLDGWHRKNEAAPILTAIDFLYKAATGRKPWPYPQLEPPNWWYLKSLCAVANRVYGDPFDTSRLPSEAIAGTVPAEPLAFIPGCELLFVPSHQQHLPEA